MQWLKQKLPLTVLGAIGPKSWCQQGRTPFEVFLEECVLVSSTFWWLRGFPGLWWRGSNLPLSSRGLLCVFVSSPIV